MVDDQVAFAVVDQVSINVLALTTWGAAESDRLYDDTIALHPAVARSLVHIIGANPDAAARRQTAKRRPAVPIVDDDGVYGVATFVNRTGEAADTPFSADDLKTAEVFGEIYATGVKLYRRIDLGTGVARMEIAEHAREFDLEAFGEDGFDEEQALRYRLPSRIAEKSAALPTREREFLLAMVDLLEEYAEREDETETGGP